MQTVDRLPTEQDLEMILGVDRQLALHSLAQKDGVSIQSVEGFCNTVRYHVSAMPARALFQDGDKLPIVTYGIVRQRDTGEILTCKNADGEHSVAVYSFLNVLDFCVDPTGVIDIADTLRLAAMRQYANKISFTYSSGTTKRWTLEELLNSNAELFLHGLIVNPEEDVPLHLGVFMTLWVDTDVLIDPGCAEMLDPDWNSIEFCIKEQLEEDRNYESNSRIILQHIYDFPRDVAPVKIPPKSREYSTLIPK